VNGDLATLRVRERGPVVMATIEGEVDIANSDQLLGELTRAVPNSARGLLIGLEKLEFLDSTGVHMLYNLAERLANRQQRLAVVLPHDRPPRRVVELSGVEPARWMHGDQASALASLGG
jgi:anti-anti-sigma factor